MGGGQSEGDPTRSNAWLRESGQYLEGVEGKSPIPGSGDRAVSGVCVCA